MKPIIFYLDDEQNNLDSFVDMFGDEWEIHTSVTPNDALNAIVKTNPWVVISDQRMPEKSGIAFLEAVKDVNPKSLRILSTAYSTEDIILDSIRKAMVFDYVKKPWNPTALELTIKVDPSVKTVFLEN